MSNNIIYLGVDLHKEFCQIAVLDGEGAITQRRVPTERKPLRSFLASLDGRKRLVVEATGNWYFFHRCVSDLAEDFALAHPLKVKAIASARIKTDKIDAAILAHLLKADLIPRCYIPTKREINQREILRHRLFLVKVRTQLKCRLRAALLKNGLRPPVAFLWGKTGREWLSEVSLPAVFRFQIEALLKTIDEHAQLIKASEEIIKRQVRMSGDARILKEISGIGDILSLTITSEVGDISRFSSPGKLASYAGLVPSTYSSGGRTLNGRITRQGSRYLRWALVEAAIHAWKGDEQLFRLRARIGKRKGRKTARVAVARRLAEIIWHKLTRARRRSSMRQDAR
jgi:transposase